MPITIAFPSRATACLTFTLLACPPPAAAQDPPPSPDALARQPIGRFVADARGALPRFDQDPAIASAIGVTPANLPTRGLGIVFGAHVYPLRLGPVTLGVGGELLASRGSKTLEPQTEGGPEGPTVHTRFSTLSPQLSLNFGSRDGWSYISGGLGATTFRVEPENVGAAASDPDRRTTVNYGGGARWFVRDHIAFSLDLRFYSVSPQAADATQPAMPRMTLMVFSAGVSFK